jgi:hypothetical protein
MTAPTLATLLAGGAARLEGASGVRTGQGTDLYLDDVLFASIVVDVAEFRLRDEVGAAALRTPNVSASPRGPGWVRFAPRQLDGHARWPGSRAHGGAPTRSSRASRSRISETPTARIRPTSKTTRTTEPRARTAPRQAPGVRLRQTHDPAAREAGASAESSDSCTGRTVRPPGSGNQPRRGLTRLVDALWGALAGRIVRLTYGRVGFVPQMQRLDEGAWNCRPAPPEPRESNRPTRSAGGRSGGVARGGDPRRVGGQLAVLA